MRVYPIIPTWIMLVICVALIVFMIKNKVNMVRRIIIICLLFIINLRVMIFSENAKSIKNNLDVLFVIDSTISMCAEDYNGNVPRITAVKQDCEYIISTLKGARFSVITFGNEAKVLTPFTNDTNMSIQAIKTIQVANKYYAKGSLPSIALDSMLEVLNVSKEKDGRKRIIFFISDGEITSEDKLKSFSEVANYVESGAVMGYGTDRGGYMKVKDIYDDYGEYIEDMTQDYPYPKAISKIDEENLKLIAKDIGIDYINMSSQSNINKKLNEIKRKYEYNEKVDDITSYSDVYFIFAVPLLALLVCEFMFYKRKN